MIDEQKLMSELSQRRDRAKSLQKEYEKDNAQVTSQMLGIEAGVYSQIIEDITKGKFKLKKNKSLGWGALIIYII